MKKNNNQKRSYFKEQQQKLGSDFIERKTAQDIQRDAIRIFRDIANGRINVQSDQMFFTNKQFLENCIAAAQSQYTEANINYQGVCMLLAYGNHPLVAQIVEKNMRKRDAYLIILNGLNAIKMTGDTQYLYIMRSQLKDYRFNI